MPTISGSDISHGVFIQKKCGKVMRMLKIANSPLFVQEFELKR